MVGLKMESFLTLMKGNLNAVLINERKKGDFAWSLKEGTGNYNGGLVFQEVSTGGN